MLLLPTPPVPPPPVAELPGPPPVAEPLEMLPVALLGLSLMVLAPAEPPVLPPVSVTGASLLPHFTLLVAVEPLLLLPVAGPGVSRSLWLLAVLRFLLLYLRLVACFFAVEDPFSNFLLI